MADDINLPNLLSHLRVNLADTSGAIADATRQGSSMGAALGGALQQTLRRATDDIPDVEIDGDSSQLDRDLARVRGELDELANQRIGVDISIEDALRRMEELEPHLERLSRQHPSVNVRASVAGALADMEELREVARQVDDTDVEIDVHVDEDSPNRLAGILGRVAGAGARAGLSIASGMAKAGAALGAVIPVAAGVVTTLANVAPAAGVAVTGMAAVQLASGAVKLAMVGVEDAVTAALDPEKAAEFEEALAKLSPEAREFALAVREMAPGLRDLQQDVQDVAFDGLAEEMQHTATGVLPILRTNLLNSATAVREMAGGVLGAARDLASSGALGKALGSASSGLRNLAGIPGVVVHALGQVGAAAGPSFERLTSAAGDAAVRVGDRLDEAFESGAMQRAIERAIDLVGQLFTVGGNVVDVIGNIFNAVPAGGGLLGVLEDITQALAEITASKEVQGGLRAIFETMGTLGSTVAPLLAQALSAIGPVFEKLGPPAQTLIEALGDGLSPIITELGPVLEVAAEAVGALVESAAPLLPVIGQLAASLLPALTPLLEACVVVFEALAPVAETLAGTLQDSLAPILAELPGIVAPFAELLATRLVFFLELLGQVLVELAPSLTSMGQSFGELLVAAAPLIQAVADLTARLLSGLMPILQPLIVLVGQLAAFFAGVLAKAVTGVVVPALQILVSLLRGDFSGAFTQAKDLAIRMLTAVITFFAQMPGKAASALGPLAGRLVGMMQNAGSQLASAAGRKISEAVQRIAALPGMAVGALGSLGGVLASAGSSLISGFISGITSRIGDVKSVLVGLTSQLPGWKGPPAKDARILTPAGRLLIEGFIKGIDGTTAKLRQRLESITKALPSNVRSGIGRTLARATKELEQQVKRRDAVLKKLAAAEKKLKDLVSARDKAASDVTKGILSEANITTGRADVNSVDAITVGLQQAVKKTKEFEANIARLRKSGLRSDLLQQIADAGVEGGAATAAALAKATPEQLKRINDLQSQLAKSATSTGKTVGDALYGAGINAAKGLVAGLKSQEKAIEKLMRQIAENMLKTVKKAHKTKSPSRAFWDIGVMDGEGLRGGLLATTDRVRDAARRMAGAALDVAAGTGSALLGTPSAGQLAGVVAGAGGDMVNNFYLYGSEASPDGILRALSWRGMVGRR